MKSNSSITLTTSMDSSLGNPFVVVTRKAAVLWQHRELWLTWTKKELKVKYKNSVLGFLWSMLNPLLVLIVFSLVFGYILRPDPSLKPFAVFLLSGLIPWNLISNSLGSSVTSIVGAAGLVKKVNFPREILPLAAVGASVFHSLLEMIVLLLFLLVMRFPLSPYLLFLPLVLMVEIVLIIGLSFIVSSLNVYFRDIEHFLGIIIMLWFWLTPIIYPIKIFFDARIPERYPLLFNIYYYLNPLRSVIISSQQIIFYHKLPELGSLGALLVFSLFLLLVSYYLFARLEGSFAEQI